MIFKNFFKEKPSEEVSVLENLLKVLIKKGEFLLDYTIDQKEQEIRINIEGADEPLLKARDGRLLLAIQGYLNKVVQNRFPQKNLIVHTDSRGFFAEKEEKLLNWAGKLRKKALATGQPVYLKKVLPPFYRRKVHQFLAQRGDVKTSSVGEGFYKTICISPVKSASTESLLE